MRRAVVLALLAVLFIAHAQDPMELLRDFDSAEADALAGSDGLEVPAAEGTTQSTKPSTQSVGAPKKPTQPKPAAPPAATPPVQPQSTKATTQPQQAAQPQPAQPQQGTQAPQQTAPSVPAQSTSATGNSTASNATETVEPDSIVEDTNQSGVRPGGCAEATAAYKDWLAKVHESCQGKADETACIFTWESSKERKDLRSDIDLQCSNHNATNSSSGFESHADLKAEQANAKAQRRNLQQDAAEAKLQASRFQRQAQAHDSIAQHHTKRAEHHEKVALKENSKSLKKESKRATAAKRAVVLKASAVKHKQQAHSAMEKRKKFNELRKAADKQVQYWAKERAAALEDMAEEKAAATEAAHQAKKSSAQQVWNEGLAVRRHKKAVEASTQARDLRHKAEKKLHKAERLQTKSQESAERGAKAEALQQSVSHNLTLAEARYKQHHAKAVHTWMEYQQALAAARGLKKIAKHDLLKVHADLTTVKQYKARLRRLARKAERLRAVAEAHSRAAEFMRKTAHNAKVEAATIKQGVPRLESKATEASKRARDFGVEHSKLSVKAMNHRDNASHKQQTAEEAAANEARARDLERKYSELARQYTSQWRVEKRTALHLSREARTEKANAAVAAEERDAALKLRNLALQRQQERQDFAAKSLEEAKEAEQQSTKLQQHRHKLLEQLQTLGGQGMEEQGQQEQEEEMASGNNGNTTTTTPSHTNTQASTTTTKTDGDVKSKNKTDKTTKATGTKTTPSPAMQRLRCAALKKACHNGDAKACAAWNSAACLNV